MTLYCGVEQKVVERGAARDIGKVGHADSVNANDHVTPARFSGLDLGVIMITMPTRTETDTLGAVKVDPPVTGARKPSVHATTSRSAGSDSLHRSSVRSGSSSAPRRKPTWCLLASTRSWARQS